MNKLQEGLSLPASPLSHLPGMVFRCRADAQRTMSYVSEGARQVTGYEPNELVQNAVVAYGDLIYERDREMIETTIAEALRERRSFQISYRIHTRVGEEKWVWEQGGGISTANGAGPAIIESIVVDITPRRMGLASPREPQRAPTEQRAAGIAHDFKNIMSILVLYSELLERQPEHPRREQYLSIIAKQAHHASRLIGQILDYSRTVSLEREILELNSYLDELTGVLAQSLPPGIDLTVESSLKRAVIAADSTRLQQVFHNLVLNARDAMPDGGSLVIALSELDLSSEEDRPVAFARRRWSEMAEERWVQIEVRDNGTGIPPAVLPHIFQPFFTTKDASLGSGLGLVQVDGILEQLGGTVGVDSRPGEGTTFTVYLPLVEAPQRAPERTSETEQVLGPEERVLVVDDDEISREAMIEAVRNAGYKVLAAASGWEALKIVDLEEGEVDLLFAAAQMRDMPGADLCRQLRRKKANLACLLVSNAPQNTRSVPRTDEENLFWIHKPYSLQSLSRSLRLALMH